MICSWTHWMRFTFACRLRPSASSTSTQGGAEDVPWRRDTEVANPPDDHLSGGRFHKTLEKNNRHEAGMRHDFTGFYWNFTIMVFVGLFWCGVFLEEFGGEHCNRVMYGDVNSLDQPDFAKLQNLPVLYRRWVLKPWKGGYRMSLWIGTNRICSILPLCFQLIQLRQLAKALPSTSQSFVFGGPAGGREETPAEALSRWSTWECNKMTQLRKRVEKPRVHEHACKVLQSDDSVYLVVR